MADTISGKISMGIELVSIERYLKKILKPNEILLNEKILGLEILNLFQKNPDRYENLRMIFENEEGLSRKNRFDLSFSIAYRLVQYQRELGTTWKSECNSSMTYGDEQILLMDDIYRSLKTQSSNYEYIVPADLPKLLMERGKDVFTLPVHIVGPSNLLYLHIEALSTLKSDISLYQLYPYTNVNEKIKNPSILLKNRLTFIEDKFKILSPTFDGETFKNESNLHSAQNKMMDENSQSEDLGDTSLQILISPSITREVEAVYSDILLNLQKNSLITPNDFLILVPNLDLYSATVRSVFSKNNQDYSESGKKFHKIFSYIITDEAAGKKSSFAMAINDFFQLGLSGNLNRRNVSTLIRHTNIQIPLGLQPEDMSRISNWFETFSFLKSITEDEYSPEEIQRNVHSFKYLLKKIRMGIFYPPSHEETLESSENIVFHPSGNPSREDLNLLEKLHRAYELWSEWILICKQNFISIESFLSILENNIRVDYSNSAEIFLYHKLKSRLLEVEREQYSLHPEELFLLVMNILEHDKDAQETILENGVTISPILPVRPIPFKFVYVLGLNKGSFGINPEKSPYDLFFGGKTKNGFHVMNAQESAGIMLHEAIFSARTQLVFGMVAEESSEKIKELLIFFTKNTEYGKYLKLNDYNKLKAREETKEIGKRISEILSESGVVLGSLIEYLQTLPLSVPINLVPLSRYSRFYFHSSLSLPGTFLNQELEKEKFAVTNLYVGKKDESIDEREYLYLFHDGDKKNIPEDIETLREVHHPLNLNSLFRFLFNPLDDFLFSVNYNLDINPDPNKEFDSMELKEKEITKLLIPKLKEGSTTKESLISYYFEKKNLWIAKGIIPSGNWSISELEEKNLLESLLNGLDTSLIINPKIDKFSIKIDQIEINHKLITYNNNIVKFSPYSSNSAIKYLFPELITDAFAFVLSNKEKIDTVSLKYISLNDGSLTSNNYCDLNHFDDLKMKMEDILKSLINEYKKGPLAYSFDKINIINYNSSITDLSNIIDFGDGYNPNSNYESIQRERKRKILGYRNPTTFPNENVEKRVHSLLSLNKRCREILSGVQRNNQGAVAKKKAVGKKKISKKK